MLNNKKSMLSSFLDNSKNIDNTLKSLYVSDKPKRKKKV